MAKNFHLINSIFNEAWLISISNYQDQINTLLTGVFDPNCETEAGEMQEPEARGTVSVISISGVLTKQRGFCGEPGMQDYGAQITNAINDPTIDAIVLKVYSGGGMVNGTDDLSQIILNSPKPIVALVEDEACSGAFWLACSCNEIVANNDIATVGSIGVLAIYNDLRKANEMKGITEHLIFADQSSDKCREYLEVIDNNYASAKERLNVVADKFIAHVRSRRPNVEDSQLTGNVYFASQVVGTLIDSIGNLDFAVNRALSLAQTQTQLNNKSKMAKPQTTALALAAGVSAFEMADDQISLNADQITAVENALSTSGTQMAALITQVADLTALQAASQATITTQAARIAELEASPGADHATAPSPVDAAASSTTQDSGLEFMAALNSARQYIKD